MTTVYADLDILRDRMMRRVVEQDDGCWTFTGCVTSRGYGCVGAGAKGKTILTHRLAVLASGRTIPEGMTVDHLCHDSATCRLDAECPHRRCVNPDHLAVVTQQQNNARQWEAGRCRKGHELAYRTRGNGKARYCPTCQAGFARNWREAHRSQTPAPERGSALPKASG